MPTTSGRHYHTRITTIIQMAQSAPYYRTVNSKTNVPLIMTLLRTALICEALANFKKVLSCHSRLSPTVSTKLRRSKLMFS